MIAKAVDYGQWHLLRQPLHLAQLISQMSHNYSDFVKENSSASSENAWSHDSKWPCSCICLIFFPWHYGQQVWVYGNAARLGLENTSQIRYLPFSHRKKVVQSGILLLSMWSRPTGSSCNGKQARSRPHLIMLFRWVCQSVEAPCVVARFISNHVNE